MKKKFPLKASLIIDSFKKDLANIIVIAEKEKEYICIADSENKNLKTFKAIKGRVILKSNI